MTDSDESQILACARVLWPEEDAVYSVEQWGQGLVLIRRCKNWSRPLASVDHPDARKALLTLVLGLMPRSVAASAPPGPSPRAPTKRIPMPAAARSSSRPPPASDDGEEERRRRRSDDDSLSAAAVLSAVLDAVSSSSSTSSSDSSDYSGGGGSFGGGGASGSWDSGSSDSGGGSSDSGGSSSND